MRTITVSGGPKTITGVRIILDALFSLTIGGIAYGLAGIYSRIL